MANFEVTSESHLDHGMTEAQRSFALDAIRNETATVKVGSLAGEKVGFAICEITLPEGLGTVPCALIGPETGESPVAESEVFHAKRANRPNTSRLVRRAPTQSRKLVAVIVKGTLATIYGGPLAPQEPGDPYLAPEGKPASEKFWSEHALSAEAFGL
jgi:hypothetical protein